MSRKRQITSFCTAALQEVFGSRWQTGLKTCYNSQLMGLQIMDWWQRQLAHLPKKARKTEISAMMIIYGA